MPGYNDDDRQEARSDMRALAARVGNLAEQLAVNNYQIKALADELHEAQTSIVALSNKITAIEFASSKPIWMSAGIALAAMVISWGLGAWEKIGAVFHK